MTATEFHIASALQPLHAGGVHIWLAERFKALTYNALREARLRPRRHARIACQTTDRRIGQLAQHGTLQPWRGTLIVGIGDSNNRSVSSRPRR